jgi:ABC-2 type transport system ATP-binding protein
MEKDNDIAISVQNVSKTFKLPHEKQTSLKGAFLKKIKQGMSYEIQEALKDVSFEVKKGEFFGIVGRNGSGKSTLLKCMAGVYTPTKGRIHINGSLVPFIELGVGFNPELSGRDNVYLNGALLGFNRKQMETMYDEIVKFAELESFMDQKLKNYSSGMQVRLAFSIAIRARGDILLLDEVLAVGDEAFQKKCFDYFDELKANNQTVILVSHSMSNVEEFCDRALFLENGEVKDIGEPQHIAHLYRVSNKATIAAAGQGAHLNMQSNSLSIEGFSVSTHKPDGTKNDIFSNGDTVILNLKWEDSRVRNIGIALYTKSGKLVFAANTIRDNVKIKQSKVTYKLNLSIADGSYYFKIAFFGNDDRTKIDFLEKGPEITVYSEDRPRWEGVAEIDRAWS